MKYLIVREIRPNPSGERPGVPYSVTAPAESFPVAVEAVKTLEGQGTPVCAVFHDVRVWFENAKPDNPEGYMEDYHFDIIGEGEETLDAGQLVGMVQLPRGTCLVYWRPRREYEPRYVPKEPRARFDPFNGKEPR